MSPVELAGTIYLGDRWCKRIVLDGAARTVSFFVDSISRIRSKSGNWEGYLEEDITDGAIVFGDVRSVDFGGAIPLPDDWIELDSVVLDTVENTEVGSVQLYRCTLCVGASTVPGRPGTRDVTIVVIAGDMYLWDPRIPDRPIRF